MVLSISTLSLFFVGLYSLLGYQEEVEAKVVYEGKTIEQWIDVLRKAPDLHSRSVVTSTLSKIGAPAVPALIEVLKVLKDRGPIGEPAFESLCRMGPAAMPAIAIMIELVFEDVTETITSQARSNLIRHLGKAKWATSELLPTLECMALDKRESEDIRRAACAALGALDDTTVPTLAKIIEDESVLQAIRVEALRALRTKGEAAIDVIRDALSNPNQSATFRRAAIQSLGDKGPESLRILKPLTLDPNPQIREVAHWTMASLKDAAGLMPRHVYYELLSIENPFDSEIRSHLLRARQRRDQFRYHSHRVARSVVDSYRRELAQKPNPELSLRLAEVIQDLLGYTELHMFVGSDQWSRRGGPRCAPEESFHTLRDAIVLAYEGFEGNQESQRSVSIGLAKLHLLMGDWEGMNRWLVASGQVPVAGDRRETLTAPPGDWTNLNDDWQACPEEFRSGTASVTCRIESHGSGLRGAHVMVKSVPKPAQNNVFSTGIRIDYLGFAATPLPGNHEERSFGYHAGDIDKTRYAVTGARGAVTIADLPEGYYQLEILIPTANFRGPGVQWDLFLETADGELKPVEFVPNPIHLTEGQAFSYPKLVIKPHYLLNIDEWDAVDVDGFELQFLGLDPSINAHYVVTMSLSCPESMSYAENAPILASKEFKVDKPQLFIGKDKVRLVPGNVYLFSVEAFDEGGKLLSRWEKTRVFVSFEDPKYHSPKPFDPSYGFDFPPVNQRNGYGGTFSSPETGVETLRERLGRYLRTCDRDFESPYARVVSAWLDWHDGNETKAREEWESIVNELAPGNVARSTAQLLIESMDGGEKPAKSLTFSGSFE